MEDRAEEETINIYCLEKVRKEELIHISNEELTDLFTFLTWLGVYCQKSGSCAKRREPC